MENGRCWMHRGDPTVGIVHRGWRTGRYSEAIPALLSKAYEKSLADPNLLGMRDELSLLDARLEDLLRSMTRGDTPKVWEHLKDSWEALQRAMSTGDADAMQVALVTMRDLIKTGGSVTEAWSEIYRVLTTRSSIAEIERRRLESLQATITAEQALAWAGLLVSSVKRNVSDPKALEAITEDIQYALRTRPELRHEPAWDDDGTGDVDYRGLPRNWSQQIPTEPEPTSTTIEGEVVDETPDAPP